MENCFHHHTTTKVTRFEIDSFRPKYMAGRKIMENGVLVI